MQMLKRVIAFIRTMMGVVTPIQPVGRVPQEPTTRVGSSNSAPATKPRKSSPVRQASQKKQKVAKQTTAVSKSTSKKQKPAQTGKSQSTRGSSTQTRVSKTRQHAK